jgi:hypothetical protein
MKKQYFSMKTIQTTQGEEILDLKSSVQHVKNVSTQKDQFQEIEIVPLVVSEPKAGFRLQPVILDEIRSDKVLGVVRRHKPSDPHLHSRVVSQMFSAYTRV